MEDEDDLLVHTINSDSSIAKLGFFGPDNDFLYCLTHTEDVCFWHAAAQDNDDDEVIAKFEDVRSSLLSAVSAVHFCFLFPTTQWDGRASCRKPHPMYRGHCCRRDSPWTI